ncbi:hypothetical protein BH11MYX1_BH11MYX1_28960 [soil metagenome]
MILASVAACGTEELSTETDNLYGLGTASLRWGTTSGASVPVCWDDPADNAFLQNLTRTILEETWESYANITFTGPVAGGPWEACSDVSGRKVHVAFSTMTDFRGRTSSGPGEDTTVTLISDRALDENYAHFRYEVIHEFGHALGFTHEMQRPDNWPSGNQVQCVPSDNTDIGNYAAVYGGINLTETYDVNSIMNYCSPVGFTQDLSLGDIRGVRTAYGRRDVKGDIYRIDDADQLLWYRHDGRTDGSFTWASESGAVVGAGWAFKNLFSAGGSLGVLYGIDANNTLTWWRHDGRVDGGFRWAPGSGNPVGWGWDFSTLFGAGDGVIYGITPYVPAHYETVQVGGSGNLIPASGGELKWYRHDGREDGSFKWAARSGTVVGTGWNGFSKVFSGGNGVIYALTAYVPAHYEISTYGGHMVPASGGDLKWYRHTGQVDGTFRWAPGSGTTVGHGWSSFKRLFSGGDGVIYAVDSDDKLRWYRHDGRDTGTFTWAPGSGTVVGNGWTFQQLVGDD